MKKSIDTKSNFINLSFLEKKNVMGYDVRTLKNKYTKDEVDRLIAAAVKEAVDEAVKIDEASMAKHNRDATVISMILGFTTLALFVDGLLRMLGIIPPFMHIDVNILEKIADRVETDVIDKIRQVPIRRLFNR